MAQKTAVEWLFDNLNITGGSDDMKAFEKAKAMEKEQIIEAYQKGFIRDKGNRDEDAEQYYNENFKSE